MRKSERSGNGDFFPEVGKVFPKPTTNREQSGNEFHKLMTREEYDALKIVGWHSVCHDFRGEIGATAVRYLAVENATLTARALVENHITHFGMVPHPDCLKEAIAEAIATSNAQKSPTP